ncbi:hypothetical protein POSPLADRAFT_1047096 [Postia placenta MAD-698-R-SB12]|uniref:Uncharacterized protein n=1 Tax=Postia placenta MAD-698-R-SB12 TaxID=670580 RepID=A0A1X6MZQ2_9APHY|nr:hypothetical protein POSPLADRAFT_1047096 [Postia placenta MAD-698-R-SB12]OSX61851.1 hypothetical protein POSPLADRAFT_1047096 [Postia placenta MAD-698-R-SB12]
MARTATMRISLGRLAIVQGCDPESDACHCAGIRPYNGGNKANTLLGHKRNLVSPMCTGIC